MCVMGRLARTHAHIGIYIIRVIFSYFFMVCVSVWVAHIHAMNIMNSHDAGFVLAARMCYGLSWDHPGRSLKIKTLVRLNKNGESGRPGAGAAHQQPNQVPANLVDVTGILLGFPTGKQIH